MAPCGDGDLEELLIRSAALNVYGETEDLGAIALARAILRLVSSCALQSAISSALRSLIICRASGLGRRPP